MTNPPINAPPPGSPPPTGSPPGSPTQEERLLAVAAYLGYMVGFWLVVPIVIYVVKRESSRFVAHHAMRALILHAVALPLGIFAWVVAMVMSFGVAIAMDGGRGRASDATPIVFMLVMIAGYGIPLLIYFAITLLGAIRAFQGIVKPSLLGRLTEWFLRQDRSVAVAPGAPPPR